MTQDERIRQNGDWGWPDRPDRPEPTMKRQHRPELGGDWNFWTETRNVVGAGLVGLVLITAGAVFGHSEAQRRYQEQNRLIPACAVGAGVAEDEVRFDFVGGVGATVLCVKP